MPTPPNLTCFIVTWDAPPASAENVRKALQEQFQWYCPIHANAWAVVTDRDAKAVADGLVAAVGPAGRLFIIRSGTAAAWFNLLGPNYEQWLRTTL